MISQGSFDAAMVDVVCVVVRIPEKAADFPLCGEEKSAASFWRLVVASRRSGTLKSPSELAPRSLYLLRYYVAGERAYGAADLDVGLPKQSISQ